MYYLNFTAQNIGSVHSFNLVRVVPLQIDDVEFLFEPEGVSDPPALVSNDKWVTITFNLYSFC